MVKTGFAPSTSNTSGEAPDNPSATSLSIVASSGQHGTGYLRGGGNIELWREEDAAGLPGRADERVQRIDRQGGEQAVGMRKRRPPHHRHGRAGVPKLTGQSLHAARRHPVIRSTSCGV